LTLWGDLMKTLILVDLQNDFMPGGALAVPGGHEVLPIANAIQRCFDIVIATADWHPPGHGSFASAHPGAQVGQLVELAGRPQMLWPDHCVQNTSGAEFSPGLDAARIAKIIYKGMDPNIDSYSGFFDNGRQRSTALEGYLRSRGVDAIYVMGLATDYCVKFTALDGVALGFTTYLIEDGCRGVEVVPGDVVRAVSEMRAAGVRIISSRQLDVSGGARGGVPEGVPGGAPQE
jgi:nicotinamidase/pyrazinamidase